jgi:hypothetical protein
MTSTTELTSGAGLRPGPGPSREPSGQAPTRSPRAVRRRPAFGARVRTRLAVNDNDEMVLKALGAHLGHLASLDLARRVAEGSLDAKGKAKSRQARKQALTAASSSRWAGAITRTSEDAYGLAKRDLQAERVSLRARVDKITKRVALGPGEAKGRAGRLRLGIGALGEQRRVQVLRSRLADVEAQLAIGTLSVCRGGKRRARAPVLRMAYHWFGLAPQHVAVDGERRTANGPTFTANCAALTLRPGGEPSGCCPTPCTST